MHTPDAFMEAVRKANPEAVLFLFEQGRKPDTRVQKLFEQELAKAREQYADGRGEYIKANDGSNRTVGERLKNLETIRDVFKANGGFVAEDPTDALTTRMDRIIALLEQLVRA